MSTPREEFTQASRTLTQAQGRLDANRREVNRQRRELERDPDYAHKPAEREARLNPLRETVRQGIATVQAAQQERDRKYDALTDPTEADGWL